MSSPILLLGSAGDSTSIVHHHLSGIFGDIPAIIEKPMARKTMIKVRIRKLGLLTVMSQLVFMVAMLPVLRWRYKQRLADIKSNLALNCAPIPKQMTTHVSSVNSQKTKKLISSIQPKVIIVNGTRIISGRILKCTNAVFINTHAGITPQYRGCHGGYWALLNNDISNCGVTVHVVDTGIDTGEIIEQSLIHPTSKDSFVTYPYLQIAAALPMLENAINSALNGSLKIKQPEGRSGIWYHPTIFQYLTGLIRGIH